MNKAELVTELSKVCKLTKKDCNMCLNALTSVVSKSLSRGESINLTGFGKFEVKNKKARNSFNPHLRKTVLLKARKTPNFKAGKNLKEAVGNY